MTEPPTNPSYPQFPPPEQPEQQYPPAPYPPAPYPSAPYPPAPYGQPVMYPPPPGTNGFAIASLVLGIIGGCFLSIIFGLIALSKIKKTGQKGRGMAIAGLVLSAIWIVLLGVVVAFGMSMDADRDADGVITGGGTVYTEDLRVGDCAEDLEDDGAVYSVDAVPCSEPHIGEVVALVPVADGAFPGDDTLSDQAEEDCLDAIEDASERAYEDESYSLYWIQPSAETWEDGDRTLICMVTTDDARTGSVLD